MARKETDIQIGGRFWSTTVDGKIVDASQVEGLEEALNLNLKNSVGEGSLAQSNKGVTDSSGILLTDKKPDNPNYYDSKAKGSSALALGARTEANGDVSISSGYDSKTQTKADAAFNSGKAGVTKEEFNKLYPNGFVLSGVTYDYENYCKKVVNGSFACNYGRALGSRTFSAGYHTQENNGAYNGSLAMYSATFGNQCKTEYDEERKINAQCSLAGGISSKTHNPYSIVYGKNLFATLRREGSIDVPSATFGQFNQYYHGEPGNKNYYTTILEIGNGIDNSNRSNAFEVLYDGRAKVQSAPKDDNDVVRLVELKSVSDNLVYATDNDIDALWV